MFHLTWQHVKFMWLCFIVAYEWKQFVPWGLKYCLCVSWWHILQNIQDFIIYDAVVRRTNEMLLYMWDQLPVNMQRLCCQSLGMPSSGQGWQTGKNKKWGRIKKRNTTYCSKAWFTGDTWVKGKAKVLESLFLYRPSTHSHITSREMSSTLWARFL